MTLNPLVEIPVYTPTAGKPWSRYRARRFAAPFVWLTWLWRGLWTRAFGAPRGRAVTVDDMRAFHPGRPKKCLCRGSGLLTTTREKQLGVQFCARMLDAFKAHAGFRVVDTKHGPHWAKGFAPEELVGSSRAERVRTRP